jgi:uncharacterized membrane protein
MKIQTPGYMEVKERMNFKFDARDLALFALFASLYAVLNVVQMTAAGGYTIYGPIQLRVADCLIVLSALLGWPIVAGVTVGCFLTNMLYFLGPVDVIFGPVANLIAASIVLMLHKRQLLACIVGALPISLIVGGYLWIFGLPVPASLESLPQWVATIVLITTSSMIAMVIIGYPLLRLLSKPSIIESLKSHGLKTFE